MRETPTAPECIVIDCHRLAALTDVTQGRIWTYNAHFCADCYMALSDGTRLEIDSTRIEVRYTETNADSRPEFLIGTRTAQANTAS